MARKTLTIVGPGVHRLGVDWTFEDMLADAREKMAHGRDLLDAAYAAFTDCVISGHGDEWAQLIKALKAR